MKSRLLAIGLLSLVLISGKSFAQPQNQVSAPELKGFDRYVLKAMQDWNIPGLAIAVVKDDKVVHARGYGVRELGKPGRVNKDTLFAIASNSKAFTATAIGMLVHEKKISWDDPVIKHMPTLQLYDPYINRELTVRDLLCHRAGYGTWDGDLMALGSTYSREEIIHRLRYLKPIYSLRSRFGYSNIMFMVAGDLIPQVTGATWDDFLKERIFTPLGMSRTNTSVRDLEHQGNVATPHTLVDEKIATIPYMDVDNGAPAGAINSSASDMTRWLRMQLADGTFENSEIVDSSIVDEMRKPHTVLPSPKPQKDVLARTKLFRAYGLGWGLADYSGRLMVSHGGGLPGMLSRVAMIPEENLGVVVLTNYDDQRLHGALVNRVFDAFLDIPAFDWSGAALEKAEKSRTRKKQEKEKRIAERDANRTKGSKPSRELRHYTGEFTNDLYGPVSVIEQGGKLILKLSAHPDCPGELEHWHYDTFLCRWRDPVFGESMIPFTLDQDGAVNSFSFVVRPGWIDPHVYEFTRKDESGDPVVVQSSTKLQNRNVTAGCAMCIFKMKGVVDCVTAVEIEGKHYLVKGNDSGIDDHGDAHAADGFCNTSRKAVATGEIKDGVFNSKKIKLLTD